MCPLSRAGSSRINEGGTQLRRLVALIIALSACLSCSGLPALGQPTSDYAELDRTNFQKEIDGKLVDLYTIRNNKDMVVKITNYGAKVEQILVPDREGKLGDVVLGYQTLDQVINGQASMNAFIGRYANRIAKGRFILNGEPYQLAINNPPNTLHGGNKGSRFAVFNPKQLDDSSVQMSYVFKDGEENFPGTVPLRVVYKVTEDNALEISYEAVAADKPTVINFTSHLFFNLAGAGDGDVLDHLLYLNAESYTPVDSTAIPTGELRPVGGTPMDFTKPTRIGAHITADDDQIKIAPGYDVNWVLNKKGEGLSLAAKVVEPKSGRTLTVYTTEPGIQFYSGNLLEGKKPRDVGKGGKVYNAHYGFCLEPQHFPDSVNHPNFPSTVLNPGQWYVGTIIYQFGVER
jgi:aldose 1-epimerase